MDWTGTWRNQFGSIVEITAEAEGRIEGSFRTALEDSGFYGQDAPILGLARGNCITFAAVGTSPAGDMVVSYTGLLRDGKMETMWFYAADATIAAEEGKPGVRRELGWWRAVTVNADTFERVR